MRRRLEKIFACLLIFLFLFSVRAQNVNNKEIRFNVSVTDERGRYAGGLKSENFQIMVDKKPQEITSFSDKAAPATVVFLIDLSGSQEGSVVPLAKDIERFVENANPSNEYIVLAFNTKIQMVSDKTEDIKTLEEALKKTLATMPKGNTAFYDSVYAAIEKAESGKYQKKILISFGDGQDNASLSYKMDDVVKSLKQSDVLFYSVNYLRNRTDPLGNTMGAVILDEFTQISGGKSFFPKTEAELSGVFDRIIMELKSQYQIGFQVTNLSKPDKWREIKIKVTPILDEEKKIKVQARTRKGFYPIMAR
ncbi:MAG: VWA domain-containing protein [Acidobacteriota bacterium]|nr:VWA domain-containing protein [Acidobacteriota bacterium]